VTLAGLERRFVLEVICPKVEGGHPDPLPRAMRRLYHLGVRPDWWKLEPQTEDGWRAVREVIAEGDPHCKGVLLLGLGADAETLAEGLTVAAKIDVCRGFAVGRSIFAGAAERWFAGGADEDARRAIVESYRSMIDVWCDARQSR
ncbi:MAG TPA: DUF2090 domain-containing protein, partial [Woeseiaceae bacterium]|nr:DUF2090 domain-containing protein [Woeseiaceae bacterium]